LRTSLTHSGRLAKESLETAPSLWSLSALVGGGTKGRKNTVLSYPSSVLLLA